MKNINPYPDSISNVAGKVYFLILFISIFWIVLIFAAPILNDSDGIFGKLSDFIYIFFSKVCHQDDARSFHFLNHILGVCSRCIAIYLGFLAGVIFYPLKYKISNTNSPSVIFLFITSALLFADVIFEITGVWQNSFLSRSVTGVITGFILPFYIIPGFVRFFYEINSFFKNKINYKI